MKALVTVELQLHPHCRCSASAYEDSDDYEAWLDYLSKGGTTEQWNKIKYDSTKSKKPLENFTGSGILNIGIDEFVPCLKDAKTGEIFDTVVRKITDRKSLKAYNKKNGWYINWAEVPKDCDVFSLSLDKDNAVQGLVALRDEPRNMAIYGHWIVAAPHNRGEDKKFTGVGGHLFAIMAEKSVEAGYGGYLYGKAANDELLKHYVKTLGATPIGNLRFYVSEEAAQRLLEHYNFRWDE